ncbi:type II toxin-antitoxin system Phd/YefM family antitoxin [Kocuria sp. p3-SID1433]|uniref:type II toxin-antitoxin system Phd/YefM family antitoxin n=1 Tax=unclassified Kocuria TaxID=2649579 RepID=UPI0021A5077D|nr:MULTISPECIES: type II toxin-antitoxin system Phd/YefM family antitoxin [unclassified Kocuria]MCT1601125.1 type II toxin-antitoxin system Phd/YefM family antitoxin [Kocuria sp. p3-SID1428]MCT2179695.1 type II toxin-antitoxin system Phd/YefM family antitoxin [Kocuria sp. p3-SID1433]
MSTAVTSRDFDCDVGAAMRAAEQGPVMVIDHGWATHVLLTVEEFERLSGTPELMGDRLRTGQDHGVEFDLPVRRVEPPRPLDL